MTYEPHDPQDNFPEDMDEIKEAAEHFFDAIQNKTKKEAQKVLDAMTEEDLRNRLLQQAQQNLMQGSNRAASAIMVCKLLGAGQEVIEVLVRQHAEVQAEILRCLKPDEPEPSDFTEQIAQMELDAIKDGLEDHKENEVGCLIAEYKRRNNDDWADTLEVQGGVS